MRFKDRQEQQREPMCYFRCRGPPPNRLVGSERYCDAMSLNGKTMFISGASRGIGLAIAKRAAQDGANIALIAKTAEPHPKLPGTVYTAAKELEDAGGQALPIVGDVRDPDSVESAVAKTVEQFGAIDICVNNASAINLGSIAEVPMKRFDLMNGIQVRGTYAVSQACLPHMKGRENPHVLRRY